MVAPRPQERWLTAALLALGLALLGLVGSPADVSAQGTNPAATIRFVHAFAGGGPIDVILDGAPIAQGLAFGTATAYASLPAGDHGLKVVASGQDQSTPYVDKTITVEGGGAYDVIVGGQPGKLDAALFQVSLDAVAVGQARYRVIQASPDLGNVTVQIGNGGNAGSSATGTDTANGNADASGNGRVGFMADQGSQDIAAGTYTINVFDAGNPDQPALSAPSISLESGRVYDLVVVGQGASQLTILPLVTDVSTPCGQLLKVGTATDACVRFVHVSPDAGPVDILVDGTAVAQNISYGTATAFAAVAGGDHKVQVAPTGQGAAAAVLDESTSLTAGQAYQLAVVGVRAADGTQDYNLRLRQNEVNLTPLPAGQARVRAIHAVPGGGDATVSTADGTKLFDAVGFASSSDYASVNAGVYDLQVQIAQSGGQAPTTINAKGVQLAEGSVYDIFAIGRPTDGSTQLLVLTAPATVRQGAQGTPVTVASPTPTATPAA